MSKKQKYKTYEEYEASAEYSEDYRKGFNEGYLMNQYEPDLLNSILEGVGSEAVNSPHIIGLYNGKKQHEREILIEQLKKSQQIDKPNGPEMGR